MAFSCETPDCRSIGQDNPCAGCGKTHVHGMIHLFPGNVLAYVCGPDAREDAKRWKKAPRPEPARAS